MGYRETNISVLLWNIIGDAKMSNDQLIDDIAKLCNAIKDKVSIYDFFKDFKVMELSEFGKNWKGKCTFCKSDKKDFVLSVKNNCFYCFSCHMCGDIVTFFAKSHNLTFENAAVILANIFKIENIDQKFMDETLDSIRRRFERK